jgi:DNA cross-link repair 1C protein
MGKRVIYVNPVKMESEKWDLYQKDTKARLVAGEEINNLVSSLSLTHFFGLSTFRQLVPLSRHSTLPELQSFVKLFRPKRIVPNTLDPRLHGLDWTCIDRMFSHCLHPSAQSSASSSQLRLGVVTGHDRLTADAQNDVDVALKNLVGDGAADAAQRWADHGRLLEKFAIVRDYLGKGEHDVVDKFLSTDRSTRLVSGETCSDPPKERTFGDEGKGKGTNAARYYARESEEDTDFGDSDDERGRTAHKLFASLAGIDEEDKENKWWLSPPSSQAAAQNVDISQELLNADNQRREEPVGDGAWRLNRLTPVVSSPIRAPTNKSGSKSRNVTPRQSQLGRSVRKKVTAKNKATPSTPRTPIPSKSITRSTGAVVGAGHSLASPICLLSSSPAVSVQGKRQTSEQIKPSASLSHVAGTAFSEHHSLNLITKEFKSISATNSMGSAGNILRETTIKVCDRQIDNIASFSAQHVVLDTSRRKHLTEEGPFFTPVSSKKRRRAASTVDPQPEITLHEINDVVISSSAVSSKEAMGSNQERIPSGESPITTEREKLALKRMDIAQQLANIYPHLVAPSYEKKRAKQLSKLMGKERGRAGADDISTKEKLVQSQTILSFETVDDDDGGMDWNRSKQLADDLRDAIANGRRPVLPSLKCAAQSPSPSPKK